MRALTEALPPKYFIVVYSKTISKSTHNYLGGIFFFFETGWWSTQVDCSISKVGRSLSFYKVNLTCQQLGERSRIISIRKAVPRICSDDPGTRLPGLWQFTWAHSIFLCSVCPGVWSPRMYNENKSVFFMEHPRGLLLKPIFLFIMITEKSMLNHTYNRQISHRKKITLTKFDRMPPRQIFLNNNYLSAPRKTGLYYQRMWWDEGMLKCSIMHCARVILSKGRCEFLPNKASNFTSSPLYM